MISPYTTLVNYLMTEQGLTEPNAEAELCDTLGIPATITVTSTDIIKLAQMGDVGAAQVRAVAYSMDAQKLASAEEPIPENGGRRCRRCRTLRDSVCSRTATRGSTAFANPDRWRGGIGRTRARSSGPNRRR